MMKMEILECFMQNGLEEVKNKERISQQSIKITIDELTENIEQDF